MKLIRCSENIKQYIIDIVNATRNADYISLGVSPRGSIALYKTAKAYAMISGRAYVIPDDIKFLAPYILAHRLRERLPAEAPREQLPRYLRL